MEADRVVTECLGTNRAATGQAGAHLAFSGQRSRRTVIEQVIITRADVGIALKDVTMKVEGRTATGCERHQHMHTERIACRHGKYRGFRIIATNTGQRVAEGLGCLGRWNATETYLRSFAATQGISTDRGRVPAIAEPHCLVAIVDVHVAHILSVFCNTEAAFTRKVLDWIAVGIEHAGTFHGHRGEVPENQIRGDYRRSRIAVGIHRPGRTLRIDYAGADQAFLALFDLVGRHQVEATEFNRRCNKLQVTFRARPGCCLHLDVSRVPLVGFLRAGSHRLLCRVLTDVGTVATRDIIFEQLRVQSDMRGWLHQVALE